MDSMVNLSPEFTFALTLLLIPCWNKEATSLPVFPGAPAPDSRYPLRHFLFRCGCTESVSSIKASISRSEGNE